MSALFRTRPSRYCPSSVDSALVLLSEELRPGIFDGGERLVRMNGGDMNATCYVSKC
jgi:hypothetical protein